MASFAGVGDIFFDADTPSEAMERMTVFSKARAYVKYERDQFSTAAQDAYLEFFRDLCAHGDYWFGDGDGDGIFSHRFNREHVDTTCCALNYLASHQRKGGHLAEALATACTFSQVLGAYRTIAQSSESLTRRVDYIQHRRDIVAMNAHQQLGDKDSCIPLFRRAVEYEIRTNMPLSVQEKSTVVYCLGWDEYYPLTLEKFRGVTDDMCWKAIQHVMAFERGEVDSLCIDDADGESVEEKLQNKAT